MSKEGWTLEVETNPRSRIWRYNWELYYRHPVGGTTHGSGSTITKRGAIFAGHRAYLRKRVNLPSPKIVYSKIFKERP